MFLWFEISQGEDIYVNTNHIVTIELATSKEEVIVVLSNESKLFISLERNCEQLKKLGVKF